MTDFRIQDFDWKQFTANIEQLIEFLSSSTRTPINGELWEELIFHALKAMGAKYEGGDPKWISGSHSPGADIWIDQFAISAKGGNFKNQGEDLSISSNLLTRFNNLNDMISYIDGEGKNFDLYLCCARQDSSIERKYTVLLIPSDAVKAKELKWSTAYSQTGVDAGWRGIGKNGVKLEIWRNMSNQLWIQVPVGLCTLITEVTFPKQKMGSELERILKTEA